MVENPIFLRKAKSNFSTESMACWLSNMVTRCPEECIHGPETTGCVQQNRTSSEESIPWPETTKGVKPNRADSEGCIHRRKPDKNAYRAAPRCL